jgi:hypothetical protein
MSSELQPAHFLLAENTNDQRHDAALTVATYSYGDAEAAAEVLQVVGLAIKHPDGVLRSAGVDEYEMPWFTPAVGRN